MDAYWTPFFEGAVAGYGIAIPVGAIAVLIIDAAIRGGFRPGFFAGAGAASADLIYAVVAAAAGGILAPLLRPYQTALNVLSAAILIGLGSYGLWRLRPSMAAQAAAESGQALDPAGSLRTYAQFLSLTLINPATVIYFASLIIGGGIQGVDTPPGMALFVAGAALASLSWQTLLAAVGAVAHHNLSPRWRIFTGMVGNLIVIGLGVRILLSA